MYEDALAYLARDAILAEFFRLSLLRASPSLMTNQ